MKDMLSLFKIKEKKRKIVQKKMLTSTIFLKYIQGTFTHIKAVKSIKFGIIRGILSLLETK